MSALIAYRCTDDGSMVPLPRFRKQFDETFACQAIYVLEEREERSGISHRHYFASVRDAWANLPEDIAPRYPNSEILRKHMLIRAGYANSRQIVASSKAEAVRIAAFVAPSDPYAIVDVKGCVVTVYTAMSQDMRSMDKRTFAASKTAVFNALDEMLGMKPGDVERHAARAA